MILQLVALTDAGLPDVVLGGVHLDADTGEVTFTGQDVVREQFDSLCRGRDSAEMVRLIAKHGWTNSKVAFITPTVQSAEA